MTATHSKPRKPGRPPGARQGKAREALLQAARGLMGEKGLPQVTAREVAERAEVNPALVAYYFGGRDGLLRAVVEQVAEEGRARTAQSAELAGDARARLRALVGSMIRGFADDPYAPRLLFEHVLFAEEDVIDRFVDDFALTHIETLRGVLEAGRASGELRDVDPESAIAAITGACIFFFVGAPVFDRAFRRQTLTDEAVDRFTESVATMVLDGIGTPRERE